jgi:ParB/RepB/Spo0J family partition protein
MTDIKHLPLEKILPNPWQTRLLENPEHIRQLAEDIRARGLLQTPIGRLNPDGSTQTIQLAFGHSRLAAYRLLGEAAMPVDLRELTDREMAELAIAENAHRQDLTAIEKAGALQRYCEEFDATQAEAGALFGLTQSAVANLIRLLKLSEPVQAMVQDGRLPERLARTILAVERISAPRALKIAQAVAAAPSKDREETLGDEMRDLIHGKDTRDLDDEIFATVWADMSVEIPSCVDCPSRVTITQGWEVDRCANPECWERKRQAFAELRMRETALATGIPAQIPVETVSKVSLNYDQENRVKKAVQRKLPYLRWILLDAKDDSGRVLQDITGCLSVGLATLDLKAWKEYLEADSKEHQKIVREADKAEAADDPKARAKHEAAVREMREEKGAAVRNKYDIDWIIRNAVALIGKGIQISAPAVEYLAELADKHIHTYSGCEKLQAFEEEIKDSLKKAEKKFKHIHARKKLVLYLMVDEIGYSVDDRKDVVNTLADVAKGLGVDLPKGWDKPPVHQTEHNCWDCGRFGSQDGKLLKAEIEDGWAQVIGERQEITHVMCPVCQRTGLTTNSRKSKKKSKK